MWKPEEKILWETFWRQYVENIKLDLKTSKTWGLGLVSAGSVRREAAQSRRHGTRLRVAQGNSLTSSATNSFSRALSLLSSWVVSSLLNEECHFTERSCHSTAFVRTGWAITAEQFCWQWTSNSPFPRQSSAQTPDDYQARGAICFGNNVNFRQEVNDGSKHQSVNTNTDTSSPSSKKISV